MHAEYLLFDLLILAVPVILGAFGPTYFYHRIRVALLAVVLVAIPFVLWDMAVTGEHWWFNPAYVLGIKLGGLPFEEILFFVAIPLACIFTWELVFTPAEAPKPSRASALRWLYPLLWLLAPVGWAVYAHGEEYTGLVLMSLAMAAWLDHGLGAGLLLLPRAYGLFGVVALLTLGCNSYLTARPIVLYGEAYQLGLRILTIPVEDFVYGIALVYGSVAIYQHQLGRGVLPSWAGRLIERSLGGYRQQIVTVDSNLPRYPEGEPRRVAVIGGGLAGLGAASRLGERGLAVTLYERNAHLGGKLGGWWHTFPDGDRVVVEHGFHAFFRHYYNLEVFLEERGLKARQRPIGEYMILGRDGKRYTFGGVSKTPVVNLVSLARHGMYNFWEVATGPAGRQLEEFVRYDPAQTFEHHDRTSFAEFSRKAQLPAPLQLVFNTFARAFFADPHRISLAELIKSFHFYYLSHDHGLDYDHLVGDYEHDLLGPLRDHLQAHEVRLRCSTPVDRIEREGERFRVCGELFDDVVLATDVPGTRAILGASPLISAHPDLAASISELRAGQRYAVLRVWLDRPVPEDMPVFVIAQRDRVLDAITYNHRIDPVCRAWAQEHNGCVLELHCYAVPDPVSTDAEIRRLLLEELGQLLPAVRTAQIVREHLQVKDDFAAFHMGMHATRPGVLTEVPGLYLAGDWVKLPFAAMLMEAAYSSGLLAANAILQRAGLQGFPVYAVPPRGLLAGLPSRPVVDRAA